MTTPTVESHPDFPAIVSRLKAGQSPAALAREYGINRNTLKSWWKRHRTDDHSTTVESVVRTHLVIPDTQAKAGVPTDHLHWIGTYIAERRPDVIVHIGDHADMPSLSLYDVGKREFEGRRYKADIQAANEAFDILNAPIAATPNYRPRKVLTLGNHEHRITRACSDDAKLDGTIGLQDLNYTAHGWKVHDFLKPVEIDGVWYCHYYANPMSGRPYSGTATNRLKTIGHTFVMGHQQTLDYAVRFLPNGQQQFGLIAGACYLHDEDYKGPQGNAHWRGVVVLHQVENGSADAMFVSLDYLCRRYEGVDLKRFMRRYY